MKTANLLLGGIVLLFTGQSQAQQVQGLTEKALSRLPKSYVQSHNNMSDARTTGAIGSRLIGIAYLQNNGTAYVPYDSDVINYSGTRGGDLYHTLKYDNATAYVYNSTTSSYSNEYYYMQTFDANNNILTSITQYWDSAGSSWVNEYNYIYTYDASNNILSEIEQAWNTISSSWRNNTYYLYTYDASNNRLTTIEEVWDTSSMVWVNSSKAIYTYDASKNELTDLYQSWDITLSAWDNNSNETWTYTSANKVATDILQYWGTSSFVNSSQALYTYDASNNLISRVSQYWDVSLTAWDNGGQDVYTYDASGDQLTDLNQSWGGSAWVNSSLTINSAFVAMLPQSSIYQNWNTTTLAFVNSSKDTFTYNSYNQITSIYATTWNLGGFWQPTSSDQGDRLYYQTFTTSVKNISNSGCTAAVYPIPANDRLHVDINWEEAQPFTIDIYDIQGRVLRQWQIPSTQSYDADITVNGLPTGIYIMKISGTRGQAVKQLVVAD